MASEGLLAAAATGDRLVTLRSLRDKLAEEIEGASSSRDVAALSRQLMLVLGEIDLVSPPDKAKGTPLDELASRRAGRSASATAQPGAATS